MLDKDALSRLIDYTIWANHRVMRACATISVDDFKRELGASFGGIRGTLAHIMWTEWIWLERWKGVSPPGPPDESELADVVALRDRWKVIEDHRRAWLDALPPAGAARGHPLQEHRRRRRSRPRCGSSSSTSPTTRRITAGR